jgi:hypothetical protein
LSKSRFEQIVYADLVLEIQKARRLIQKQDGGVLSERPCDENPLAFAAAKA